jgi:hypothetical protein
MPLEGDRLLMVGRRFLTLRMPCPFEGGRCPFAGRPRSHGGEALLHVEQALPHVEGGPALSRATAFSWWGAASPRRAGPSPSRAVAALSGATASPSREAASPRRASPVPGTKPRSGALLLTRASAAGILRAVGKHDRRCSGKMRRRKAQARLKARTKRHAQERRAAAPQGAKKSAAPRKTAKAAAPAAVGGTGPASAPVPPTVSTGAAPAS